MFLDIYLIGINDKQWTKRAVYENKAKHSNDEYERTRPNDGWKMKLEETGKNVDGSIVDWNYGMKKDGANWLVGKLKISFCRGIIWPSFLKERKLSRNDIPISFSRFILHFHNCNLQNWMNFPTSQKAIVVRVIWFNDIRLSFVIVSKNSQGIRRIAND